MPFIRNRFGRVEVLVAVLGLVWASAGHGQLIEDAKLVASDGATDDYFSVSVSLSGDRLVVGAHGDDDLGNASGAVYVFAWDGSAWVEEIKLTASDGGEGDVFGGSVSLSGNRLVVGAKGDGDLGNSSGSAYVFAWDGSAWVEEAKLNASDGAPGDRFGASVSLSGDRLLVGAYGDDDFGSNSGSAYVFAWDGSAWVEETKLNGFNAGQSDFFGLSVSLSGDRLVVGARGYGYSDQGAAHAFAWDGSAWVEETMLLASDGTPGDYFGYSVSLSGDRLVVGALFGDDYPGSDWGSAYVFAWDGSEWVEETKLNASDGAQGDNFGESVSLAGNRLVVGGRHSDVLGPNSGSAYVFSYPPLGVWAPGIIATYNATATVPIFVDNTTGSGIVAAEVFVAYDGDLLTALSADATGSLLVGDWSIETNIVEGVGTSMDTLKMAMATDDDELSGFGKLIFIDFQVADIRHPASSPLILTHVLFNDGIPDNTTTDGSVTLVGVDGTIESLPVEIIPRWSIDVTVTDADEDRNPGSADAFDVDVTNGLQTETLTVTETDVSTGIFTGTITTVFSLSSTAAIHSDDNTVQAMAGDEILFAYVDSLETAGVTVARADQTDVIGGTDGALRVTIVTQPGDTVRVRVTDADLNTDPLTQETTTVAAANSTSGEVETITLTELDIDNAIFFGIVETAFSSGSTSDGVIATQKGEEVVVTYADTLLANGGIVDIADIDYVVDPLGDADGNGSVQAFDAAKVLLHVLLPYLTGLDSLSANLDLLAFDPVQGKITPYDASLVLQKRVGLIDRFEVQEDEADNHPQPETDNSVPKRIGEERLLALRGGDGYLSVWANERDGILSGDLLLEGVDGSAVLAEELSSFLSASRVTRDGLRVVFAGAAAVSGPGELLRIDRVGPDPARLTQAELNDGRLEVRLADSMSAIAGQPLTYVLHANVPNPFNPETSIRFDLAQESVVRLEVFDVVGQQVRTLVTEQRSAGTHRVVWDGRDERGVPVSSGIYVYRLQAGTFEQVRRMLLLK